MYTLLLHISDFLQISYVGNFLWRISPPDKLSCGQISPHDKKFSTGTACGARDKYEVCQDPHTTCGCGRPSNHILKQGIIFSNFIILKHISKSLDLQDLQSLKIAFSNYRLIEYFLHDFVCKGKIKNLELRCECLHKADIVTI